MSESDASSSAAAAASASSAAPVDDYDETDAEIEEMRRKVEEMEEEQKKMNQMSSTGHMQSPQQSSHQSPFASHSSPMSSHFAPSSAQKLPAFPDLSSMSTASSDIDGRSIYVSQVDYSVTEDELKQLFEACGPVERATIMKDKYSGQPKGFGFICFVSADSIVNAMILNDTEFKGRTLKITPKRTNIPGYNRGRGGGSRGARGGRGAPRGAFGSGGGGGGGSAQQAGGEDAAAAGGYGPIRGRGGRGRGGRGRGGYHPYQYQY